MSRSGEGRRPGFEGGQNPLIRRIPKRGFHSPFKKHFAVVNVGSLAGLGESRVTPETLVSRGVVRKLRDGLKVLGEGEVAKPLTVEAHRFSRSAREKIEKAGGRAVLVGVR
jgi:large subunit ribosomal protein L15